MLSLSKHGRLRNRRKIEKPANAGFSNFGGMRIRTADPLHAMQMLYQLSYTPEGRPGDGGSFDSQPQAESL